MSCEIVTGKKIVSPSITGVVNDNPQHSYLFDYNSTNKISRPIFIDQCQAYKFSTFNLPDGVSLMFHRVIVAGGKMPQGSGCLCAGEPSSRSYLLYSEPFKIDCKQVKLTNCDGALFLTIPGTYVLELSDEKHLGNFIATADKVDCCCLPSGLIIGNVGPHGYVGTKAE